MIFLYRLFMRAQVVRHNLPSAGSRNGHNNFLGIQMKRKAACPHYASVRFQEHVECAFDRMTFLPPYLAFVALGLVLTGHPLVLVAAIIPTYLLRLWPGYVQHREMRGQSVESYIRAHLYGEDYDEVDLANGRHLAAGRSYRRGFKGESPVKIAADLRKWRGWAEKMCTAFERDIRGWL